MHRRLRLRTLSLICSNATSHIIPDLLTQGGSTLRCFKWEGPVGYSCRTNFQPSQPPVLTALSLAHTSPRTPSDSGGHPQPDFGFELALTLSAFTALGDLCLRFGALGIIDEGGVWALCRVCARLPVLQRLNMDLADNGLCDIGCAVEALGQARVLEELHISLSGNPLGQQSPAQRLVAALVHLPHGLVRLSQLRLDVFGCMLGGKIQDLVSGLHFSCIPARCNVTLIH